MTAMRELADEASIPIRFKTEAVLSALAVVYDLVPADRDEALKNALSKLDDLILSAPRVIAVDAERELVVRATALLICVARDADPPVLPTPSTRTAVA